FLSCLTVPHAIVSETTTAESSISHARLIPTLTTHVPSQCGEPLAGFEDGVSINRLALPFGHNNDAKKIQQIASTQSGRGLHSHRSDDRHRCHGGRTARRHRFVRHRYFSDAISRRRSDCAAEGA